MDICKTTDQGLVYGWATITTQAGELVVDSDGEVIETAELEKAARDFMLHHRAVNEMHRGEPLGTVVEAVVMSPEKAGAMGFPEDVAKGVPTGLWIGVQLDPQGETFAKVKRGELSMFSIEGTATPVEVQ